MKTKTTLLALAILVTGFLLTATPARAETTNCTAITSLPAVIDTQGIYCFTGHLSTADTSGKAIEITTNNVVIDLNGFKLGGLGAGAGTNAYGIYASQRKNITIRNGSIRGFYYGIYLTGASGSGHLVEEITADGNTYRGIVVFGTGTTVRNNRVVNTGGSSNTNSAVGLNLNGASGATVVNNSVSNTYATSNGSAWGFAIEGASNNSVVKNNRVSDTTSASGLVYGMAFYSNYVTGEDNYVNGTASSGTRLGIYSSLYNILAGNRVISATNGIYCSSTTTSIRDNIVSSVTSGYTGCTDLGNND